MPPNCCVSPTAPSMWPRPVAATASWPISATNSGDTRKLGVGLAISLNKRSHGSASLVRLFEKTRPRNGWRLFAFEQVRKSTGNALVGCLRRTLAFATLRTGLGRRGQAVVVRGAGQAQDLGYRRARLIVRPVGVDEDKGLAGDVLDLD